MKVNHGMTPLDNGGIEIGNNVQDLLKKIMTNICLTGLEEQSLVEFHRLHSLILFVN